MIPVTTFAGKTVAVFGLGGSGLATCHALIAGGANVIAFDDDARKVAEAKAANVGTADLRSIDWSKIAALILTPGVPLTHPEPHWSAKLATAANVEIIGDVELFCRERRVHAPDAPFVAITGTNGKSTTTALIAHILREAGRDVQMGGNIGVPVLQLEPPTNARHYVIECSSYQIDLAPSIDPTVGIMLNVTPDHIDRHGTIENYAAVKSRILGRAKTRIVGVDDEFGRGMMKGLAAMQKFVVPISIKQIVPHGYVGGEKNIYRTGASEAEDIADLTGIGSLRGSHNMQNAVAAFAACSALGVDDKTIQAALRTFPGLAHRMEEIGKKGAVLFINDSKATNADSAAKALASFENIYWIAGGKQKEGGIESLTEFFPRIAKAYLIGEAAPDFAATLNGHVPYDMSGTLDAAVAQAARDAASGGKGAVVLLSPACASFDQFRNFEIRGEHFRTLVQGLL
ncbi:UDP-N-acetylmuramoyl-L-alanine--D-glutamate ligase [Pseudorhodoplanes sinuspersici]|uniref:UDP-N-acetylmuramoylalanine--D-glutamate ligase n=1 Tax=Pseudorhodoplanes sinuspersici TaxID=1235591 RepID=A0A1W6ZS03_9HYPH|nr:UDP-N-acetylmuramoyl-L-alanine--D-glutamate ligase [Pseudorhodoplanes sinuspersici]ARQ00150.1 UDP-N-acetylmuramoyl-L-alanine--D-glutamate ligase [Pseudorhodoplanes sinuspersici]RKE67716.1 UDP-N-acetylmuramoylalanine--D-glutamate ligase [Pseudorhodoplanes sinuspersici]